MFSNIHKLFTPSLNTTFYFKNVVLLIPKMTQQLLINFSKSLKYHNYDNAKFIGSILLNLDPKYHLLLPISLYLDGEYSRSIFFLTEIDTYTSNFYLALNYMKLKNLRRP
ncbi:nuclear scaffold like protein [Nosema bombycis CQ1]|uniref:Nuclear scaffold like protein n=1 Tax=Nosema bombycis (strain CQ1 / CVCC 102059) TaxID=578461 RepID=R0MC33_NOSB1|nr:nuclear scaffold like protein [Nosema bombycis CQ1]|eukprot:EOB11615.1 nuclear scaffold like protein [Nosema bombycis CQ1]